MSSPPGHNSCDLSCQGPGIFQTIYDSKELFGHIGVLKLTSLPSNFYNIVLLVNGLVSLWTCHIEINGRDTMFKANTGAQVTVMAKDFDAITQHYKELQNLRRCDMCNMCSVTKMAAVKPAVVNPHFSCI